MLDLQSHFILPVHPVSLSGPLPKGAEQLSVRTSGGETLYGVRIPGDAPKKTRTLILGFGGNAWNGQDVPNISTSFSRTMKSSPFIIGATHPRQAPPRPRR